MKNKSFTLIELLVVIVIIGILAGVIVVSTSSAIQKANFAKAQAFSSTVKNELFSDLVSEWTFDNVSNPGEDTGGNNDGAVINATYKPRADGVCVYGGCYFFNGTTDYIDFGNKGLDFGREQTISFWIDTSENSIAYKRVFAMDSENIYPYTIGLKAARIDFTDKNNSGEKGFPIILNQWNYIVIIPGGLGDNSCSCFLNGSIIIPTATAGGYTFADMTSIGSKNNTSGTFFSGLMDDIRIYNAVLSSAQIKQQYIAGLNSLLANGSISNEEYLGRINFLASY